MKQTIQFKLVIFSFLFVMSMSSFNTKKEITNNFTCPVTWDVTSTITLDQAEAHCLGQYDDEFNFTFWNGQFIITTGTSFKIWFNIDFPPNNPAGTLTFTKGTTVLYTISVPTNSAPIAVGTNGANCGDYFYVDFQ